MLFRAPSTRDKVPAGGRRSSGSDPIMIEPQASLFWQMGLRSGLIDGAQLQECWDAIAPEKLTADAVDRRVARRAVDAGYLTSWQAQQILRGRATDLRI